MPVMKRLLLGLQAVGLMMAGLACGSSQDDKPPAPPTFPVKGQVTLDGQPLAGVFIVLHPLGGGARAQRSYGRTAADGSFTLSTFAHQDGAPPGRYAVTILWPDGDGQIPQYASPETSGIRVELKEAPNELAAFRLRRP
jgi:hypothetical protein